METISYKTEVKARKDHFCSFCHGKIKSGELYCSSTHKLDGDIYTWRTHKDCNYISSRLNMYEDCQDGVSEDDFNETISEKHFDLLVSKIPKNQTEEFSDIIHQLQRVRFLDKLAYVIRFYKNEDSKIII